MGFFRDMEGDGRDAASPLGDGTADTAAQAECPCCGAAVEVLLDPGGGSRQEYVEDCEVCCRPWQVRVHWRGDGSAELELSAADE